MLAHRIVRTLNGPQFPEQEFTSFEIWVCGTVLCMAIVSNIWWCWVWRRNHGQWKERLRQIANRPVWSNDLCVLLLVIFTLATIGLGGLLPLERWGGGEGEQNASRMLLVQSVVVHWAIIIFFSFWLPIQGRSWSKVFGISRERAGRFVCAGFVAYLVMMPAVVMVMVLNALFMHAFRVEMEMQDVVRVITSQSTPLFRAYFFVLGAVVAPIAEELLFRGLIFPLVSRRFGVVWGMILVSIVFASVHLHVVAVLPLFAVSICFCLAYGYTGSLVVPIIMHMLFNAVHLFILSLTL